MPPKLLWGKRLLLTKGKGSCSHHMVWGRISKSHLHFSHLGDKGEWNYWKKLLKIPLWVTGGSIQPSPHFPLIQNLTLQGLSSRVGNWRNLPWRLEHLQRKSSAFWHFAFSLHNSLSCGHLRWSLQSAPSLRRGTSRFSNDLFQTTKRQSGRAAVLTKNCDMRDSWKRQR